MQFPISSAMNISVVKEEDSPEVNWKKTPLAIKEKSETRADQPANKASL